jgi:RNA polymerase sigma-70 factor (ECF subfamily)
MCDVIDGPFPSPQSRFDRTRWSLVRRAAFRPEGDGAGLEEFCRIYWYPLYVAARRKGQSPEDACDVVQALFERLITKDSLRHVDPERGRLRTWLLTQLDHLIIDRYRAGQALKRGGGQVAFVLDAENAELALQADPGLHVEPHEAWRQNLASVLLDEALEALAVSYQHTGKGALFDALLPALEGPMADMTYDEVAARLGTSAGSLRMAALRFRDRFRRLLRAKAALALGVEDGPELDRELRALFAGGPG